MTIIACLLEHSIEADVSPAFAWTWRTDIKNWDDPPARFQLDGPFAQDSWGTTRLPDKNRYGGKSATFGPVPPSSSKYSSTALSSHLSGCSTPCRTDGLESRNALSSRATMPPHTLIKFEPVSARRFVTA